MKRYLWIFAVLPFLWSCIAEDSSACPQPRGVSVRMSVCPDPMTAVPRAADEEALRDLNFYLLDADGNVVQHRYQSSPTLRFECLPGNYLLRIAANMGRDLGENPASEDFTVTHADEYDTLPMSYEGEVSIPSSDETVTLPTVEVQRVVAKITYNISVAPDAGDIRLHSVQPVNLPARVPVFDPGLRAAEYTAGEIVGSSSQTLTGTFYMLPNLQGEVPSIADQRDKGPANAPADATFLRIRALRGSKVLDYYIYPGGNNTSNFDIRANTHYRLDIMIRGDAEVDTRIRAYTVEVLCTPEAALSNGFLLERQPMRLTLRLGGAYEEAGVEAFVELKTGDVRYFGFEGQWGAVARTMEIRGPENDYDIRYWPPSFTREECRFMFRVHILDRYGEVASFGFPYCYAHLLRVYTKWFDGSNGKGTVASPDALRVVEDMTLSSWYSLIYCPDEGCTLVAEPDAGRLFEGWCRNADHTGVLSYEEQYRFSPDDDPAVIYAYFRQNHENPHPYPLGNAAFRRLLLGRDARMHSGRTRPPACDLHVLLRRSARHAGCCGREPRRGYQPLPVPGKRCSGTARVRRLAAHRRAGASRRPIHPLCRRQPRHGHRAAARSRGAGAAQRMEP